MEDNLRSELETLLTVERSMLESWFKVQESSATTLANNQEIRTTVAQLLVVEENAALKPEAGATAPSERDVREMQIRLEKELEPAMSAHDFVGFVLATKNCAWSRPTRPTWSAKLCRSTRAFSHAHLRASRRCARAYPSARHC